MQVRGKELCRCKCVWKNNGKLKEHQVPTEVTYELTTRKLDPKVGKNSQHHHAERVKHVKTVGLTNNNEGEWR